MRPGSFCPPHSIGKVEGQEAGSVFFVWGCRVHSVRDSRDYGAGCARGCGRRCWSLPGQGDSTLLAQELFDVLLQERAALGVSSREDRGQSGSIVQPGEDVVGDAGGEAVPCNLDIVVELVGEYRERVQQVRRA